jgi:hypothetical protein
MSKTPTSWVSGESPASSAKQNEQTRDYLTFGLPIWNVCQWYDDASVATIRTPHHNIGWYPYHEDKCVYDTLRLMFGYESVNSIIGLDVTFDSGATWTDALAGAAAAPVNLEPITNGSPATTHSKDWPLTGIVGFQWIGIRVAVSFLIPNASVSYIAIGFLYNATDTPF